MSPLANILVATDFSACATRAVDRAARLAHDHHAALHLVHVMDRLLLQIFTGGVDEDPLVTAQRLLDSARGRLHAAAALLASHFGLTVKDEVLIGRAHREVAQYVKEHAIDLSVFGAHGENFVRDVFVGSTASRYLRKSRQPTLVVRSEQRRPYRQVLVAVDFSPASRVAVEWALRIAAGSDIYALHVIEIPFQGQMRFAGVEEDLISIYKRKAEQEARGQLNRFLSELEGTAGIQCCVMAGAPARTIVAHAQMRHADLIVVGKRGNLEFDEVLLGSVALRVLEECDRDLLLVASPAASP